MKHVSASLIVAFSAHAVQACPFDLRGTWKSDRETSMAFVRENAKLQPKTEAFLAALYGHMTLTFTRREVHLVMPDIEVPVSGESRPFAGSNHRAPYRVLFCSSTMMVWSGTPPFGSETQATTAMFEDPDMFWVYSGNTDPKLPDLHAREYFRRVR